MEELRALSADIRALLDSMGDNSITDADFDSQMMSFVEGNGFDVFRDSNTITVKSIKAAEEMRRNPSL
jgi:hypothetical protein